MKTFKEGDRVTHPTDGEGTVLNPYTGTGWATVQFDNGKKLMTDDTLLTLVPVPPSARFRAGDAVHHSQHGSAVVVLVEDDLNLVTIQPTFYVNGETVSVHPVSLTHEVPARTFKIGDRVSHPLHRDGTVDHYSEHSGLYTVDVGGGRAYFALEHQITAAKKEPKFHVLYQFTHGNTAKSSGIPMNRQQTEAYLTNYPDWDNIESITITRAKG